MEIKEIPLDQIRPNADQPRKFLDEPKLKELADSIKSKGLLEEILVRPKDEYFEIVHGERRWRACKLLGLKTIKGRVENFSDQEAFEISLVENIQREDLDPVDEAEAIKKLIDTGLTQREVGKKIGKTRDYVAKKLQALRDLERADKLVEKGEIGKEEVNKFKEDVRRRTISPEVLRELVKPQSKWVRDEILEKSPTVQEARELTERARQEEQGEQLKKDYPRYSKVRDEFLELYPKEKEKYLNQLPSTQRAFLEQAQIRLRYAGGVLGGPYEERTAKIVDPLDARVRGKKIGDEVKHQVNVGAGFKKKWWNTLYIDIFDGPHMILPLNLLKFNWWLKRKDWSLEKLIEASLFRLNKLLKMANADRKKLLEKFLEEFEKIYPDFEKVDIYIILATLPEEVWRKIYRQLQLQFHPDRGGDPKIAGWLVKLNEGIKNLRDWK